MSVRLTTLEIGQPAPVQEGQAGPENSVDLFFSQKEGYLFFRKRQEAAKLLPNQIAEMCFSKNMRVFLAFRFDRRSQMISGVSQSTYGIPPFSSLLRLRGVFR